MEDGKHDGKAATSVGITGHWCKDGMKKLQTSGLKKNSVDKRWSSFQCHTDGQL